MNPLRQRLAEYTLSMEPGECWVWAGRVKNGEGFIRVVGQDLRLSRVSWEVAHGEIPKGMKVCHSCRNKLCWNPEHLFLNRSSGRQRKLTMQQAWEIRESALSNGQLAKIYGVPKYSVRMIRLGRTYKEA